MSRVTTMTSPARTYLPAAGRDVFLPFYDTITDLLGADRARAVLLDYAQLQDGNKVLDLGSGTGALAVLIKRLYPRIEVTGLDPDPKALARARRKASRADVAVQFEQGFGDEIKHPSASFDVVSLILYVSSPEIRGESRHSARSPASAETGRPPASFGFRRC